MTTPSRPSGPPGPVVSAVSVHHTHPRLELDPEVLQAETPEQFRAMLARIASAANLKPSQIALKSGIPRSQAYAMIKPLPVLPSKPRQVEAFLRVCNVAPEQVDEVMQLWTLLSEAPATSSETGAVANSGNRTYGSDSAMSVVGTGSVQVHSAHGALHISSIHESSAADLVGLLRYVVSDERRTNRAMRLLTRVGSLQIPPLMFVAYLITRLPESVAVWVAAIMGVLLVTAVAVGLVKFRRMLRRERSDT